MTKKEIKAEIEKRGKNNQIPCAVAFKIVEDLGVSPAEVGKTTDLIEFEFVNFTLVNVDEARIRGAELAYEYQGDSFTFSSSFINQRAENRTTDARLLRRAEQSVSVRYQQNIGEHRLGLSVLGSGDREDFGGTRLAGYVLANLTGIVQVSERLQVNARVENLLDTDYETAAGFRMQERSFFVELRSQW